MDTTGHTVSDNLRALERRSWRARKKCRTPIERRGFSISGYRIPLWIESRLVKTISLIGMFEGCSRRIGAGCFFAL